MRAQNCLEGDDKFSHSFCCQPFSFMVHNETHGSEQHGVEHTTGRSRNRHEYTHSACLNPAHHTHQVEASTTVPACTQ